MKILVASNPRFASEKASIGWDYLTLNQQWLFFADHQINLQSYHHEMRKTSTSFNCETSQEDSYNGIKAPLAMTDGNDSGQCNHTVLLRNLN